MRKSISGGKINYDLHKEAAKISALRNGVTNMNETLVKKHYLHGKVGFGGK